MPASIKAPLKSFQQVHARYLVAAGRGDAARIVRDGALQQVADADATLDDSLEVLAQKASGDRAGAERVRIGRHPSMMLTWLASTR